VKIDFAGPTKYPKVRGWPLVVKSGWEELLNASAPNCPRTSFGFSDFGFPYVLNNCSIEKSVHV
jgi:hypothetical protein